MKRAAIIAVSSGVVFTACGGHDTEPPSSKPIAAIAHDALFVVNGASGSISVIDTETEQLAATIELVNADFPHHVYMSSDRLRLLVAVPGADLSGGHSDRGHGAHGGGSSVLMLDAKTGATLAARVLDASNHNAIFSPNGAEVWTAQTGAPGAVLVLDPATLATRQSIAVGDDPAEVTFSADGRNAFAANGGSDSVTVIDAATKAVAKTIAVGDNPVGAWAGGDGIMYVDNETAKSLTAIDATTLEVVRTYALGFTPAMAATAPNGELWVTDTDAGRLVFFAAGSDTQTGELATRAGAHAIAFSADGTRAYVSNQQDDSVSIVDVAMKSVRTTIAVGGKPNGILFRAK